MLLMLSVCYSLSSRIAACMIGKKLKKARAALSFSLAALSFFLSFYTTIDDVQQPQTSQTS